jgi:hypothetical protein
MTIAKLSDDSQTTPTVVSAFELGQQLTRVSVHVHLVPRVDPSSSFLNLNCVQEGSGAFFLVEFPIQ